MRASLALPLSAGPLVCAALALPARAQEVDGARVLERRTQEIRASAAPSVVGVRVTTRACGVPRLALPGLLVAPCAMQPETIEGTGFFVASRGVLVTTRDLVVDAARIEVRFLDGTCRDASLLGIDGPFHVAVLRTSPPDRVRTLPHVPHVEAHASTVGWFFGAAPCTVGTPSVDVQVASVRPAPEEGAVYDRFLYAPISLARGAAGGPLVGGDGRLLGMAVGSLVGRSGATPTSVRALFVRGDDVADAARQIADTGVYERPMIGAFMEGETNRIDRVLAGGPAEAASLADGDAVVAVGPLPVANYADLARALLRRRAGERVDVVVERAGRRLAGLLTLAAARKPAEPTTPAIPGAVVQMSMNQGEPVFAFVEVKADAPIGRAGVRTGDRLLAVDGFTPCRFFQRHRARPAAAPPTKIEVERDGAVREFALPAE
jgi:serine protease Do